MGGYNSADPVRVDRLKTLGLYDSSLIVLQADHGSVFDPIVGGVAKSGLPIRMPTLLTVKPPGMQGALKISHVPSNVADVPATILGILGLAHRFKGTSVFELEGDPNRKRMHVTYVGGAEDPLVIRRTGSGGSIHESANWSMTDQFPVAQVAPEEYEWGEAVQFGIEGNAAAYVGRGWTTPGSRHGWNSGHEASLNFLVPPTASDLELEMKLKPFLAPGRDDEQPGFAQSPRTFVDGVWGRSSVLMRPGACSHRAGIALRTRIAVA